MVSKDSKILNCLLISLTKKNVRSKIKKIGLDLCSLRVSLNEFLVKTIMSSAVADVL